MFTLLDDQNVTLRVSGGLDLAGNPVDLGEATVVWTGSDPSLLSLQPSEDGLSCLVVTTGHLGKATVTATATLPGGHTLMDAFAITIAVDVPSSLNITADTPTFRISAPTEQLPTAEPAPAPEAQPAAAGT